MIVRMRNGDAIEVQMSSRSCPPDFTGLAGNKGTVWWRALGGDWVRCRSAHETVEMAEIANDLNEFMNMMETFGS
jgi:translation initiation factor IF-1